MICFDERVKGYSYQFKTIWKMSKISKICKMLIDYNIQFPTPIHFRHVIGILNIVQFNLKWATKQTPRDRNINTAKS